MDLVKAKISGIKDQMLESMSVLAPSNLKKKIKEIKQMSHSELAVGFARLLFLIMYHSLLGVFYVAKRVWGGIMFLMQGPPIEKVHKLWRFHSYVAPLSVISLCCFMSLSYVSVSRVSVFILLPDTVLYPFLHQQPVPV